MRVTQRKKLKKESEIIGKNFNEKAGLEKLHVKEELKEDAYMEDIRSKRAVRNKRIIALLIVLGFLGTLFFLKYGGERLFGLADSKHHITYHEVWEASNKNSSEPIETLIIHTKKNKQAGMITEEMIHEIINLDTNSKDSIVVILCDEKTICPCNDSCKHVSR